MAELIVKDQVSFEREKFFEAFRDKVGELHHHLPDIDKIETLERKEVDDNTMKVVNHWKANGAQLPKALRMFIKPDLMSWKEHATYNKNEWASDWSIEMEFLKDAISCEGKITFEDKGDNTTEVVITGDLKIDPTKIPGLPKIGAGKIGKKIEDFAIPMITSNLSQYIKGVKSYLEGQ